MTELRFEFDRTGFPMVYIDAIGAFMHWMPVTKLQFEYFMCSAPDSQFGEGWYEEILQPNPRVSPGAINASNYWRALLTNILPEEAQRFARWCGDEYEVPTLEVWSAAYKALKELPPESGVVERMGKLKDRVRTTLNRLDSETAKALRDAGYDRTLADQMLMRMGVLEWVECPTQRVHWGGMGELNPRFHGFLFRPDSGQPSRPVNPENERLHYYGARLIRRV
jgi:hypothetical protein